MYTYMYMQLLELSMKTYSFKNLLNFLSIKTTSLQDECKSEHVGA